MTRSVYVYGVVLLVSLLAAYLAWTGDDSTEEKADEDSTLVWDLKPTQLKALEYTSDDIEVKLKTQTDELGQYLWAETKRQIKLKDLENPHHPHALVDKQITMVEKTDEYEIRRQSFKASGKTGEDLIASFAPFNVRRNLGKVEDLKPYKLDEPRGTLKIVGGTERVFDIGGTGYAQRHTYLRDQNSGEVLVIRSRVMKPILDADARLPDKVLHPFEPSDIAQIKVSVGSDQVLLRHRNPQDRDAARWTFGDSDEPSDAARSWLENKFFNLQAKGYVPESLAPETPELLLTAIIEPVDGTPIRLELFQAQDPSGETIGYAKSTYTRGWVKVPKTATQDAAQDFSQILEK